MSTKLAPYPVRTTDGIGRDWEPENEQSDYTTDSYNLYRLMGAAKVLSDRLGSVFMDDETDMAAADLRFLIEQIEQRTAKEVKTTIDDGDEAAADLPW